MCCKIKNSAVKCIHYSWYVICLQGAYSKRQYFQPFLLLIWERHEHNSTKSIFNRYCLIPREGISAKTLLGIFGECQIPPQLQPTTGSHQAPCHGLLSPGSSQKSKTHLATWAQAVPMGCGPDPIRPKVWNTQPPPGAVPHASLSVFDPSQPLGFIAVPLLLLPTICTLGTMPHSHLLLPRHTA